MATAEQTRTTCLWESLGIAGDSPEQRQARAQAALLGGPYQFVDLCPLCDSPNRRQLTTHDRYGLPVRLMRCTDCDMVYLAERLCDLGYSEFYARGIYRNIASAWNGWPLWKDQLRAAQHEYAAALKPALLERVGKPTSVLDIGGSSGYVSMMLTDHGTEAEWVLVDPAAHNDRTSPSDKCQRHACPVEEWHTDKQFDLILLCQTIDHLAAPHPVFERVKAWLAAGGRFFFDILDFEQEVAAKGYEQTAKLDHPCSYTDETARKLIDKHGLKVVDSWESTKHHIGYLCEGE